MSGQSGWGNPGIEEPRTVENGLRNDTVEGVELRLIDGYRRIDVARARGDDVSAWEDFWIDLLHRYEALCDDVRVAA